MTASTPSKPFRFRDLPSEIRNKIYRIILCEFDHSPGEFGIVDDDFMEDVLQLPRVEHRIETSILRTSKEIYREAYDVMVKTNRFVKVTSAEGMPVVGALSGQQTPVVTQEKFLVDQFKGYVLSVHFGLKKKRDNGPSRNSAWYEPLTAMVLHRHLDKLCQGIKDGDAHSPGFSESLKISIRMAPVLDNIRSNNMMPTFDGFFSEKMQKSLFAPLRANLHGYKGVEVKGHVDSAVATALRQDIAKDPSSDPAAVLTQYMAAKEEGTRLFHDGQVELGCLKWQDAAVELDMLIVSSSWPGLVRQGKEEFVAQLAQVYFIMRLNIIHVQLSNWSKSSFVAEVLADDSLNCAFNSLKQDYWMKGYKHAVSVAHKAKYYFRYATFLRLQADPGNKERALGFIDLALRKQPGDLGILREKEKILEWMRQL
ncbi:hypothetical protein COCMIDRAFT_85905 [Bipolaris oryzae ATCC 44560]|uniref:Uncharacterized protein n=1 Tax=Bipolaris oryzae ATCC 44560 TaxID=930090 RepID=W6ZYY5_COCMI|nr:uncharacterized protein COCMIDRAFT_85905 [Bipolaris oryzae ATCC 44560]EUC48936.1 hypothetical protein COCMIDRAFT_85905 [Bipolaris oryzae ATCC 44560]